MGSAFSCLRPAAAADGGGPTSFPEPLGAPAGFGSRYVAIKLLGRGA